MKDLLQLAPVPRMNALVRGLLDDSGTPDPRMERILSELLSRHPELLPHLVDNLDAENDELTPHLLTWRSHASGAVHRAAAQSGQF